MMDRIRNYMSNKETLFFNNTPDAILGLIVMVLIPSVSLCYVLQVVDVRVGVAAFLSETEIIKVYRKEYVEFMDYTFPIISVSLAEMYDTFGRFRWKEKDPRIYVFITRIIFDIAALLLALITTNNVDNIALTFPPIMLLIPGLIITFEFIRMIYYSIKYSTWSSRIEQW